MILVGLTGGIGAGKSTVSALLAEKGAAIVDADRIARDLQAPGSPVLAAMAERFGRHIIGDDGTLDRAEVARIVWECTHTDFADIADKEAKTIAIDIFNFVVVIVNLHTDQQ